MSVRCCSVEGGTVVTCVDDQKIISANATEADTEFQKAFWTLKLEHVFSKKHEPHQRTLLYEPVTYTGECTGTRTCTHTLLPFGFNLIIVNPRQDLSGQDG